MIIIEYLLDNSKYTSTSVKGTAFGSKVTIIIRECNAKNPLIQKNGFSRILKFEF